MEASKSKLRNEELKGTCLAIQDLVIRQFLQLAHPVIPHITEELWNLLEYKQEDSAYIHDVPVPSADELRQTFQTQGIVLDEQAAVQADKIKDFISRTRALKAEYNLGTRRDVTFFCNASGSEKTVLEASREVVLRLLGAESLEFVSEAPEGAPACVTALGTAYLNLAGSIDVEAEKDRLNKELEKLRKAIASAQGKLSNKTFTEKAPAAVVEGVQNQMNQNLEKVAELESLLKAL